MKFTAGDVLLARFPFTDLSSSKQRPVVVLSVDNEGEDVIVCAVTSRPHNGLYDIIVSPSAENGLKVLSRVQFDKIATLSKAVISGRIGVMPTDFMRHYKPLLLQVLGLDTLA